MKHTKYLRAGSLVCLLALCLGLLTACGGATLPLDKLYVDDARPGKPVTLNTATEVFREKGTLEEVYGNLALFITRNEDSSLLKESSAISQAGRNCTNRKRTMSGEWFTCWTEICTVSRRRRMAATRF